MSSRPELRLDWCSHAAAKYAVEHWHYSKTMPAGKLLRIGVWEGGQFIGCVLFGYGATPEIVKPYGLQQTDVCELVRVALAPHATPTSRVVAIATKMLHRFCPGLRLIVSFADSAQNHHGGIYQAAGWTYVGSTGYHAYQVNGVLVHPRTLYSRYGVGGQSVPWLREHVDSSAKRVSTLAKHKYLMPLDDAMRKQIAPLAKPYPKREPCGRGEIDSPPQTNAETGGASPTRPLSLEGAA